MKRDIVIVDLDGTLADCKDIAMKYLHPEEGEKNWKQFEKEIANPDIVVCHPEVVCAVRALAASGYEIHLWTGRTDATKKDTVEWLRVMGVPYDYLLMRPAEDKTDDYIVKKQWLDENPDIRERILFVLEDRDRVVKMWRENGIRCFQVRPGAF